MADEQTIAELEAACTDKERAFAYAFVDCLNQTEAVRRAKYDAGSYDSLRQLGRKLRRKPHIAALIDALLADTTPSDQELIAALTEIAFGGSLSEFIVPSRSGFRFDLKKAEAAGKLHLLKSITRGPKGTRLEMYDRLTALTTLAKIKGMFIERMEGRMDVVQMSLDEWRKQRDVRREQAAQTLNLIEEEEPDA